MIKIIGLTGNIGCGKTTVGKILETQGIPVVDADQISRELTKRSSPILQEIKEQFGPEVFNKDGSLNREKVREVVFNNPRSRKILEVILHPAIAKRSKEYFKKLQNRGHSLVVYEASLIIETGSAERFDGILLITCPEDRQIDYIVSRKPKLSAELARTIAYSQMPQNEKRKHATWVIENNGTIHDLRKKVLEWVREQR